MSPMDPSASISGSCQPRFERVREEFERNFRERGEVGASVCVTVDGEAVVDLWGGLADADAGRPWTADTVSIVWSSTKGATALCAHVLASRGLLDLDAPVARYWPEFAQAGKDAIPVYMLLNHQAGVPVLRAPVPAGGFADWELMTQLLAAASPVFPPGTRHGYAAVVFGWLVGELVRRISGKSLGRFFQDEIAGPLGIDFWIGLPESIEPRVAPVILPAPDVDSPLFKAIVADPGSLQALVYNDGGFVAGVNSRAARAAEVGAASGITNARGLAGLYAPLATGGRTERLDLVDRDTLARMARVSSSTGQDAVLLLPARFTLGYIKSIDNRRAPPGLQDSILLGEDAFGHPGFGGSVGFADPRERLSFGYTMNKMGPGLLLNPRGQSLVDAVYRSLGYESDRSGAWIR